MSLFSISETWKLPRFFQIISELNLIFLSILAEIDSFCIYSASNTPPSLCLSSVGQKSIPVWGSSTLRPSWVLSVWWPGYGATWPGQTNGLSLSSCWMQVKTFPLVLNLSDNLSECLSKLLSTLFFPQVGAFSLLLLFPVVAEFFCCISFFVCFGVYIIHEFGLVGHRSFAT